MVETFIKIGLPDEIPVEEFVKKLIRIIRLKIDPMISRLRKDGIAEWYCFLIHDRESGVPTTEDDNNFYFHIRLSLENNLEPTLPEYCSMTRPIRQEWVESITGISKHLLRNEEIEEAWRIIGEQSEWLLDMLKIYKDDAEIPLRDIGQFFHFLANVTQLQIR